MSMLLVVVHNVKIIALSTSLTWMCMQSVSAFAHTLCKHDRAFELLHVIEVCQFRWNHASDNTTQVKNKLMSIAGLLSLVAVPPSTLSAPSTEPPPNSTSPPPSPSRPDYPTVTPAVSLLGCQSFLIAGHFHLSFTKGRRVPATVSALRQLVNGPGQTGQSSGQTSPSGSQSGAEHQQQRQVQWQQQMGNMFADLQHNDKVRQVPVLHDMHVCMLKCAGCRPHVVPPVNHHTTYKQQSQRNLLYATGTTGCCHCLAGSCAVPVPCQQQQQQWQ